MYRRISIVVCILALILSGCTPSGLGKNNDETKKLVKNDNKGKQAKKVQITPKIGSSDQYRTVVNFQPGAARGGILYGVNNRLDIDEIETGLMRLSKPTFSPNRYVYEEGQYLSQNTIDSWLRNKSKNNPKGLNPPLPKGYNSYSATKKINYLKSHPSYLDYVLEQDYLIQEGNNKLKLGGISLAISMAAVYSYMVQDNQGRQYDEQVQLNTSVGKQKAKQYAQVIVKRIRSKYSALKNVPIVIGLYQEQTKDSLVPGHYFARTVVSAGSSTIGNWKKVNESHVLFPSTQATNQHKTDADKFAQLTKQIQKYFPNFIGVIGKGFYVDHRLQKLTVDIPIKFYGETEVMSFTQYVAGLLTKNPFSKQIPISINISSTGGPEALIVWKPGMKQPFVHLYH